MSYTSVGIASTSYSEKQQPEMIPVTKLKKGMKVLCYVDQHEGNDDDGRSNRILAIKSIVKGANHATITFCGPLADEPDSIRLSGWVKIEK